MGDALNRFFTRILGSTTVELRNPNAPQSKKKTGPGFDQPMMQPKGAIPEVKASETSMPQSSGFRLSVPSDQNGGMIDLPPDIAQQIGNVFEPSKQATAAATVLHHPMQQTRTAPEIKRLGENRNRGENPEFIRSNIDIPNPNGSIDRGLFRINDQTFNGMMASPFWREAMKNKGITSWADMEDPNKNIEMARLILARGNWDSQKQEMIKDPSWVQWYAAPLSLRQK